MHLILEHEGNVASHLRGDFDAQWNDDLHNAMHVLWTGETEGYYQDYAEDTVLKLARGLVEGFHLSG